MKATAWELEDSTSVIMHTDDSVLIIQGGGEVVVTKEQLQQILILFTKESSGTQKQVKKYLEDLKVGDKCLCVYNARYPKLYTEHETYLVAEIHEDCVMLEDNISPVRWSFTENHHFREMFDVLI